MKKKIIFDISHPAQVHQFKYIYRELELDNWKCLFVTKDKDVSVNLLKLYELDYIVLSKSRKGLIRKIFGLPYDVYKFFKIVKEFKPGFILNRFSIHAGMVSKITGIVNIAFSDTEHARSYHSYSLPFINIKFSGVSYYNDLGRNHFKYNSNIELFYLHPRYFEPDNSILNLLGVQKGEKYVILRFVSWDAHHDVGHSGFGSDFKLKLVEAITKYAKVFITSEGIMPENLLKYKIEIPPHKMHDALAFSAAYIGEGGTMASEAACLGTPSVYVNSLPMMGYLKEESSFGLLYYYKNSDGVIDKVTSLLANPNLAKEFAQNRNNFMKDKINASDFIIWFLKNYPKSLNMVKNGNKVYNKFK